jgi:1-phosphatidylinositol-3-phosphate 5-kinase
MTMLTNFWAERSASSWPQLEYPINATDHIFFDSDVIIKEHEPSSLVAFALDSEDYRSKLAEIRQRWEMQAQPDTDTDESSDGLEMKGPQASNPEAAKTTKASRYNTALEKSLLRPTGMHVKYQFAEGSARMTCQIFYAEQFDALRRKCGVADRFVESLSRCLKWDSKGGKTKSVFLKTLDERFILKSLSPSETSSFLRFAPDYFSIMSEALFHDLPSVIAKMFGFFRISIKNPVTNTEIKLDLLVMENLFYDRCPSRTFDLKGSMRNRKIQSTGEQNEVLLDENMVEYIYESPLFAREHSKRLLRASVFNDTLFLAKQDVMDYSLMVAVDEVKKEIAVGIIDCIRTYTWDKQLESWIKNRGFAGGGRNRPTVTSPREYKSRFREAMAR